MTIEEAARIIDPEAFHSYLKDDGNGAYWHGRRNVAIRKAIEILQPDPPSSRRQSALLGWVGPQGL